MLCLDCSNNTRVITAKYGRFKGRKVHWCPKCRKILGLAHSTRIVKVTPKSKINAEPTFASMSAKIDD